MVQFIYLAVEYQMYRLLGFQVTWYGSLKEHEIRYIGSRWTPNVSLVLSSMVHRFQQKQTSFCFIWFWTRVWRDNPDKMGKHQIIMEKMQKKTWISRKRRLKEGNMIKEWKKMGICRKKKVERREFDKRRLCT